MSRDDALKRIIYIPFDHLHRKFGALKDADLKTDVIAFVESARMTTGRNWHTERLFFLISSARHFAKSLEDEGFTVENGRWGPFIKYKKKGLCKYCTSYSYSLPLSATNLRRVSASISCLNFSI